MKITMEVDCSPEEARRFLGLPDVSAANEALTRSLGERMSAAIADVDAEAMAREWISSAMSGMEDLQKAFWQGFAESAGGGGKKKD
jgi:hypothetical protein